MYCYALVCSCQFSDIFEQKRMCNTSIACSHVERELKLYEHIFKRTNDLQSKQVEFSFSIIACAPLLSFKSMSQWAKERVFFFLKLFLKSQSINILYTIQILYVQYINSTHMLLQKMMLWIVPQWIFGAKNWVKSLSSFFIHYKLFFKKIYPSITATHETPKHVIILPFVLALIRLLLGEKA